MTKQEELDAAWDAYVEATAPARAAYKEAKAPAWAAYEEAVTKIEEKYKDD